jgi:hypothetical protein
VSAAALRALVQIAQTMRAAAASQPSAYPLVAASEDGGGGVVAWLLMANMDYIVDVICQRLRFLHEHPGTPLVLQAVLAYTGVAIVPFVAVRTSSLRLATIVLLLGGCAVAAVVSALCSRLTGTARTHARTARRSQDTLETLFECLDMSHVSYVINFFSLLEALVVALTEQQQHQLVASQPDDGCATATAASTARLGRLARLAEPEPEPDVPSWGHPHPDRNPALTDKSLQCWKPRPASRSRAEQVAAAAQGLGAQGGGEGEARLARERQQLLAYVDAYFRWQRGEDDPAQAEEEGGDDGGGGDDADDAAQRAAEPAVGMVVRILDCCAAHVWRRLLPGLCCGRHDSGAASDADSDISPCMMP